MSYVIFSVEKSQVSKVNQILRDDMVSRQSIVLRDASALNIEKDVRYVLIEGTDEAILRGGRFAGGATVVKVSRPEQDMRLDVPVVGLQTLECMIKAGIRVLALETRSSIFLDQEEFLKKAGAVGISVVGVSEASLKKKS